MRLVDANILLRILLADDPAQAKAAGRYLETAKKQKQALLIHELVVAEVVWVLTGKGWRRDMIAGAMLELCADERVEVRESEVVQSALRMYLERNVSFVDAFQAAYAAAYQMDGVVSFDRGLDALGVKRVEPK